MTPELWEGTNDASEIYDLEEIIFLGTEQH